MPGSLRLLTALLPPLVLLGTTLLFLARIAASRPEPKALLVLGGGSATLFLVAINTLPPSMRLIVQGPLLLLFAASLGFGLASRFQAREWILPVLVVLSLVDAYSVLWGPTRAVMEHEAAREAASYAMVTYPSAAGEQPMGVASYFGFPDAVAMALFMGLASMFGLGMRRTALACCGGLFAALLAAGLTGQGLPALPYLCGAFVIAHVGELRTDRRSLLQLGGVTASLVAIVVLLRLLRGA